MKKPFGVLLVFVVMVLTACGTTMVPEIVAANAELEVQIITSESDSTVDLDIVTYHIYSTPPGYIRGGMTPPPTPTVESLTPSLL